MRKRLEIGTILSRTFDLYGSHWRTMLTLAGVFAVIQALLQGIIASSDTTAAVVIAIVSVVPSIVLSFVLSGMFTLLVADIRDGRQDETLGEIFGRTTPLLVPLILTSLLAGFFVVLGFIALIVGAIVVGVFLSLVGSVVMLENRAYMDAIKRSWSMVSGVFWPMLGLIIVVAIIGGVANALINTVLTSLLPGAIGTVIAGAIAYTVTMPIQAMPPVLAYFQLREQEEPADDGALPPAEGEWGSTPGDAGDDAPPPSTY